MQRRPQKVIVTGAAGVGKTVLVEALSQQLKLPVIPELARQLCGQLGYSAPNEIPDQEDFKKKVLAAQLAAEEKLESFISDRSTIDCWVLWQRWNICSAMTYDTEAYYSQARERSVSYTKIVYIPPMFAAVDDGFRWTEPDYQKQIDRIIRMTLYDWDLWPRTYTIQSEGLDNRVNEVLPWLRSE